MTQNIDTMANDILLDAKTFYINVSATGSEPSWYDCQ